jgi:hypothetical protein
LLARPDVGGSPERGGEAAPLAGALEAGRQRAHPLDAPGVALSDQGHEQPPSVTAAQAEKARGSTGADQQGHADTGMPDAREHPAHDAEHEHETEQLTGP